MLSEAVLFLFAAANTGVAADAAKNFLRSMNVSY
jgi:hypothetical protein